MGGTDRGAVPGSGDEPASEPSQEPAREPVGGQAQQSAQKRAGEPSQEPTALLGELTAMRRRARSARHAYWFPLVLFGLLTCGAAPLYLAPPPRTGVISLGAEPIVLGGMPFGGNGLYLGWYWVAALLGGYLLSVLWYRRHARRAGVQTADRGYLITGMVLTIVVALISPLSAVVPALRPLWLVPGDVWIRGTFAFLIIAAGLWVLTWAERSIGLLITAVVYTGAAVLSSLYNVENILFRLGWSPRGADWSLTTLPGVLLPAGVLLTAGAAAFLAQRRSQRATAIPAGQA